jgi:LPS sulfotransferase NodH
MEVPGTLVVFTTQRSGSNFLGSLLLQSWTYGWLGEWLNPVFEAEERDRQGVPKDASLVDYLCVVRNARRTPGKGWAIKLMPDHWRGAIDRFRKDEGATLREDKLFQSCFPHAIPIHLYRSDLIAQAVSLAIAQQTNVWRVFEGQPEDSAPMPVFDRAAIEKNLDCLKADNEYWQHCFERLQLTPMRVEYESLVANPRRILEQILQHGLYPFEMERLPEEAHTRRQGSAINREWIERFSAGVNGS